MNGVVARDEGFRIASAGLPRSVRPTTDPQDAIVAGGVLPGATAVVLRTPLADAVAVPDVPVVLVRPFLRPDVAADAVAARGGLAPRLVVAECAATDDADAAIADAVGWLRVLAGGPLDLVATERTPGAALAAFAAGGITATLTVTLGAPRSALHVRALGETVTEVIVDAAGRATVTTSTAAGATTAPRRWEDADRLALRRALAALGAEQPPGPAALETESPSIPAPQGPDDAGLPAGPVPDVGDLRHDAAHAASVISAVDPRHRRPAVAAGPDRAETGAARFREDRR